MQSRPNPHDAFFRQAFGSPRHVAGLLKLVLPKRLRALLDLDPARIRLHDAAHIDPALRGTASDLIVEVPRRGGVAEDGTERAPAIFIFAVEHQRRDERFVVLRQLGYTVRIWERWLRDHPNATHLPPVVPVVIHNGDRPWRAPASLSELIDLPDVPLDAAVRSYLPSLELVVADLAGPELTREALRASDAEPVSETLLEILQGASGPEASALFDEWTARLRPLQGEPAGGSTLCAVLCYLTHVSAIPRPRISAAAEALPEPEKETFMTAAQEWMLEGLEKGLQQGIEQGIEKGRQEGRQEGERATLNRLVHLRFRDVPPDVAARIEAATPGELERWIERILTAETVDALFA